MLRLIEDIHDPRVADFRDLKDRDLSREGGRFVVEGALLVRRLLESELTTQKLLVDAAAWDGLRQSVQVPVPAGVEVLLAPAAVVDRIVGFPFHRGALAIAHRPSPPDVSALLRDAAAPATLVCLPATQDADNVGSIIRSAAAMGCVGVLFGPQSSDPYYRRSVRVSMGAAFTLPLARTPDLPATLRRLREQTGARIVATVLDEAATPLRTATVHLRQVLLFGNEAQGLDAEVVSLADERVTIPMRRGVDSLSVSTAAAVVCHHYVPV